MNIEKYLTKKTITASALSLAAVVLISCSVYTVQEGNVGIIKRWGKAVSQVDPGMHFKIPFADSVVEIDVRTRKYTLNLSASTTGKNADGEVELQMPSRVTVSANWNIPKDRALEVYKKFGGLAQYEERILNPKVTRSVKQVFPHYDIETIISDRETVRGEIEAALTNALSGNMVKMSAINLENVVFHGRIADAVTKKQVAKLQLQEQRDILAKQNLKAQESTNVSKAEAAGITAISIAKAAAVEREGLAEAKAITAKAKALAQNSMGVIKLTEAQNWDGKLPTTILGSSNTPILDMRVK